MATFSLRQPLLPALAAAAALTGCGGGGGGGGDGPPPPGNPAAEVTISGEARYEFVPAGAGCTGLDFDAIELRPIRQATIELLDAATDAVLDSAVTDDAGTFALVADADTEVYLRVRAELKRTGTPAWNVEVRDNTSATNVALGSRPIYVLDGAPFDTGAADSTRNVTATTGWGGSSYTGARAAAPFAVLDTVYTAMGLVLAEDAGVVFPPLDVFWSVNNRPTPSASDIDNGEIGTSFFRGDINALFLLGAAAADTEEFDDHVIAHEWGHYFEDEFSRSDNLGGAHSLGDALDMRVAFGEGWATALSGIALDSPSYCDTQAAGASGTFSIDIEDSPSFGGAGWYNEVSVLKLIYDLWDAGPADDDGGSLGFAPIYAVMTGEEAETPAFTSVFSFAAALRAQNSVATPFIDSVLAGEGITVAGIDAYGSTETNDAGAAAPQDVLPVYTEVVPDGSGQEICSNSQFDLDGGGGLSADGNKLSEFRYLKMMLADAARLDVSIVTTEETVDMLPPDDPDDPIDQSDPDFRIFRAGEWLIEEDGNDIKGLGGAANQETFTTTEALPAGEYVMDLVEFRYQDPGTAADFPARSCFDVAITALP